MNQTISKNWLEWSVFLASIILVFGVLSFLGFAALTNSPTPPHIQAHIIKGATLKAAENVIDFQLEVENLGGETAHNVELEVDWKRGGDKAGFTLDHVPHRGRRSGWVSFDFSGKPKPKAEDLEVRIIGYAD